MTNKIQEFFITVSNGRSEDWRKLGLDDEKVEILNRIGEGLNEEYRYGIKGFNDFLNSTSDSFDYFVTRETFENPNGNFLLKINRLQKNKNVEKNPSLTETELSIMMDSVHTIFSIVHELQDKYQDDLYLFGKLQGIYSSNKVIETGLKKR